MLSLFSEALSAVPHWFWLVLLLIGSFMIGACLRNSFKRRATVILFLVWVVVSIFYNVGAVHDVIPEQEQNALSSGDTDFLDRVTNPNQDENIVVRMLHGNEALQSIADRFGLWIGDPEQSKIDIPLVAIVNILLVLSYAFAVIGLFCRFCRPLSLQPRRQGGQARAIFGIASDIGVQTDDRERWSDSIYFLGFILTLAALIVAIGGIDIGDEDNDAVQLARIVAGNAIALSSTVMGLVLRTLMNLAFLQPEKDEFVELERRVNLLANSCSEAQKRITQVSQKFLDANTRMLDAQESASGRLTTQYDDMASRIEATSDRLGQSFKTTEERIASQNHTYQKATADFSTALDNVNSQLQGLRYEPDLFADYVRRAVMQVMGGTEAEIEAFNTMMAKQSTEIARALGETTSSVTKAVRKWQASVNSAADRTQNLEAAIKRVADLAEAFDVQAGLGGATDKAIAPAAAAGRKAAGDIETAAGAVVGQLSGAGTSVKSAADSAADLLQTAPQELVEALSAAGENQRAAAEINRKLADDTAQRLKRTLQEIERVLTADTLRAELSSGVEKATAPVAQALLEAASSSKLAFDEFANYTNAAATAQADARANAEAMGAQAETTSEALDALTGRINAAATALETTLLDADWQRRVLALLEEMKDKLDLVDGHARQEGDKGLTNGKARPWIMRVFKGDRKRGD